MVCFKHITCIDFRKNLVNQSETVIDLKKNNSKWKWEQIEVQAYCLNPEGIYGITKKNQLPKIKSKVLLLRSWKYFTSLNTKYWVNINKKIKVFLYLSVIAIIDTLSTSKTISEFLRFVFLSTSKMEEEAKPQGSTSTLKKKKHSSFLRLKIMLLRSHPHSSLLLLPMPPKTINYNLLLFFL